MDCLEAVQYWHINKRESTAISLETTKAQTVQLNCHIKAGPSPNELDGRNAFLLAFGAAIEVEVNGETVSAFFGGDASEPLLVQVSYHRVIGLFVR